MRCTLPAVTLLVVACLTGACSRPAPSPPAAKTGTAGHDHDHDHADHDHPETFAEGVAQLKQAAAAAKAHLAAGNIDAADDVVHGVGHLVEDIHALLPKASLSAESQAAATKALDEIFTCFDELDSALHAPAGTGGIPADVQAKVAKRVEDAIQVLESAR